MDWGHALPLGMKDGRLMHLEMQYSSMVKQSQSKQQQLFNCSCSQDPATQDAHSYHMYAHSASLTLAACPPTATASDFVCVMACVRGYTPLQRLGYRCQLWGFTECSMGCSLGPLLVARFGNCVPHRSPLASIVFGHAAFASTAVS